MKLKSNAFHIHWSINRKRSDLNREYSSTCWEEDSENIIRMYRSFTVVDLVWGVWWMSLESSRVVEARIWLPRAPQLPSCLAWDAPCTYQPLWVILSLWCHRGAEPGGKSDDNDQSISSHTQMINVLVRSMFDLGLWAWIIRESSWEKDFYQININELHFHHAN